MFVVVVICCVDHVLVHMIQIVISVFLVVYIDLGLSIACIPSLRGQQFSQSTVLYTVSNMSWCGYLSKGRVFTIAHTLLESLYSVRFLGHICHILSC